MQENRDMVDFNSIWCDFCERVDFTQPSLVLWEEEIKRIVSANLQSKALHNALALLCSYLVQCDPDDVSPLCIKGKKISLVLQKTQVHPNPADFMSGYIDIVQSNLGMDEVLNREVGAIFKDHPNPQAFAQAVIWLAYTKLLNSDNLKKVLPYVALWFDEKELKQYYREEIHHAFTQEELDHFLEVSTVLSKKILIFHLACRLCQLEYPLPRLKTALARMDMHFRENTFFLKYLPLFLQLPKQLAKSKYPDKVALYLTKYLSADIFRPENPQMASNLHQLIDYASLWFDPPHLQAQWDFLYPEKFSQEVLNHVVFLSHDLATNKARGYSLVEYLDGLSDISTGMNTSGLSDNLSLNEPPNISFFFKKTKISTPCPQIKNSIQADKRKKEAQSVTPNLSK